MNPPKERPSLPAAGNPAYGLFLQQAQNPPLAALQYLHLFLGYRYGLDTLEAKSLPEATALAQQHRARIRSVFLILDQEIRPSALSVLSQRGQVPLFLLVPASLVDLHRSRGPSLGNVFVYAWEELFTASDSSLQQVIETQLG